jgi:hypothetical protein
MGIVTSLLSRAWWRAMRALMINVFVRSLPRVIRRATAFCGIDVISLWVMEWQCAQKMWQAMAFRVVCARFGDSA